MGSVSRRLRRQVRRGAAAEPADITPWTELDHPPEQSHERRMSDEADHKAAAASLSLVVVLAIALGLALWSLLGGAL